MISLTRQAAIVLCLCALVAQVDPFGTSHNPDREESAEDPDGHNGADSVDGRGQPSVGAGYSYAAKREYSYGQSAPRDYYSHGHYGSVSRGRQVGVAVGARRGGRAGVAVGAGRGGQAGVAVGAGRGGQAGVAVGAGRGGQAGIAVGAGRGGKAGVDVGAGRVGQAGFAVGTGRGVQAGIAVGVGRGRQAGVAFGIGRGGQAGVAVGAGRGAQAGRRRQVGGGTAGGKFVGVAGRDIVGRDGKRGGMGGCRGAAGRGAGSIVGSRRFVAVSNPSDAIAFSGNRKSNQFFFRPGPVIFDDVTTNIGGGYNKDYGVFTAFESGIYLVSYNVVSPRKGAKTAAVDLLRNNEVINSAAGSGYSGETSNSAVVFLNRYDQLSVQGRAESAVYCGDGGDDAFCSFNVALLKTGHFTDSKVERPVPGW